MSAAFNTYWMVLVMVFSLVFEVSLILDDDLIFIYISRVCESTVQSSDSVSVAGREDKPKTRVQYQYEQL